MPTHTDSGPHGHAAPECGITVSKPVNHATTCTTTHLPTSEDGRLTWPSWHLADP